MEIDQSINLAMWISQGKKHSNQIPPICVISNSNICNAHQLRYIYMFKLFTWLLITFTTYLKISCTSKYQLKFGKCFECFILHMRVYVRVQWSKGIILTKRHELDTWHVKKNANIKWHETTSSPKASEVITITCYTHHAWHK
jgi:hypothetical protein